MCRAPLVAIQPPPAAGAADFLITADIAQPARPPTSYVEKQIKMYEREITKRRVVTTLEEIQAAC